VEKLGRPADTPYPQPEGDSTTAEPINSEPHRWIEA
jgi:hypothetical protein